MRILTVILLAASFALAVFSAEATEYKYFAPAAVANGQFTTEGANSEISYDHYNADLISTSTIVTYLQTAMQDCKRSLGSPLADGKLKMIIMQTAGTCSIYGGTIDAGTGVYFFVQPGDSLLLMAAGGKWRRIGGIVRSD